VGARLSDWEKERIWSRRAAGDSLRLIARGIGRPSATVYEHVADSGGVRPPLRRRAARQLTVEEREEISRGLAAGVSVRAIARRLGRAPSSVCREINRNGGRRGYRAQRAERAAWVRAARPKPCRLAVNRRLRELVAAKLADDCSPQQIAGWLVREFPDDPELRVSHETIYLTLFVQARGALRRDLSAHLRTRRTIRAARHKRTHGHGQGQIVDAVSIRERPAEAEDRAVPGHWEGDMLIGDRRSQIATLVERQTRFVLLIALPNGKSTEAVVAAVAAHVQTLPEQLRRSLTWDRGNEFAMHKKFTIDTGVQVYFCDPKSPWQRGSNENTNGLLRQYFPKRASMAGYTQADLDQVAAKLNRRPRATLDFATPAEKLAEVLR
jgi:IS30 family transposase